VTVVGGGFVGLMSGLWISRINPEMKVTLIDRQIGGQQAASFGCAGSFAPYGNVPVNNPNILYNLPKLMGISDESTKPLVINWKHLYTMRSWISQFLYNCRAEEVEKICDDLGSLTQHALPAYEPFFREIDQTNSDSGLNFIVSADIGHLNLFLTPQSKNLISTQQRVRNGNTVEDLSKEQIQELLPELNHLAYHSGQRLGPARFTTDPEKLILRLLEQFLKNSNNQYIPAKVDNITMKASSLIVHYTLSDDSSTFETDQLVLSGGIYSKELLKAIGDNSVPLDTERGYHLQLHYSESSPKDQHLSRTVAIPEKGVYLTPMSGGIRAAGLVEIGGGTHAPPTPGKHDYLFQVAKEFYPPASTMKVVRKWMGFRPTLPDSRPVIGRSQIDPRIIYAFGHQHIGMTLGGITGKLVGELLTNQPTSVDLSPFSPTRFSKSFF
jgi:D-amino-acid dehydrogenase